MPAQNYGQYANNAGPFPVYFYPEPNPPHVRIGPTQKKILAKRAVDSIVVANALSKSAGGNGMGDVFSFGFGPPVDTGGGVTVGNPDPFGDLSGCVAGIDVTTGLACGSGGTVPSGSGPVSLPPSGPGGGFNLGSLLSQITASVPGIISSVEGHPSGTGPGFTSFPTPHPVISSNLNAARPPSGIGGSLNISTGTLMLIVGGVLIFLVASGRRK